MRDSDWVMLSEDLDGKSPFLAQVGSDHVRYAAMYQNRTESEIRERLKDFACLGVSFDADETTP